MQAVDPVVETYVPAAQLMHADDAETDWYSPDAQFEQPDAPVAVYLPIGQVKHAVDPVRD